LAVRAVLSRIVWSEDTMLDTATRARSAATSPSATAEPALRGSLGVISLAFTVIAFNGPIGILAGFIPIVVLRGNGLGAPLMFALVGTLVYVFAIGLNAMASRMTQPGAFYTYIKEGLGMPAGLVAGFLAIASYLLLVAGTYALFASVTMHLIGQTFHVARAWPWWTWAVLGWTASTLLSLFNIDLSAKVLGTLSAAELLIAVAWNIAVFWNGGPEGRAVPVVDHLFSGSITLATAFAILCMTGFESLQIFRSETKNAERAVPIATSISIVFLAVLYISSSYAFIISIGKSSVLSLSMDDLSGATLGSFSRYLGPIAAYTASMLLTTSMFAACLAIQNIAARYLFMFGREGVLPAWLGTANDRHGSPMLAAATSGVIGLAMFGSFALLGFDVNDTLTYFCGIGGYCLIILWVLTSFAIIVFFTRRRHVERANRFQTLIAPLVSGIGLAAILWVTTSNFSDLLGGNQVLARFVLAGLALLVGLGMIIGTRRARLIRA
jgi:amino acid transporter